jgi:hypothetical protein
MDMLDFVTCAERSVLNSEGTLNRDSPQLECNNFSISLKDHQKSMIFAMHQLESTTLKFRASTIETRIGVVGDCVGSGKTYSIMGLLSHCPILKKKVYNNSQFGMKTINVQTMVDHTFSIDQNLIVVPHSLISQWCEVVSLTSMKYSVVSRRKHLDAWTFDSDSQITLVTSTFYDEFVRTNDRLIWSRVIYDESDTIKLPSCIQPESGFYWFITSSLENILFPSGGYFTKTNFDAAHNRNLTLRKYVDGIRKTGFIKDIFKSLEHNDANYILKNIVLKTKDSIVSECMNMWDPNVFKIKCEDPMYMRILNGIVGGEVIQLLNAGNVSGAIERLGVQTSSKETIIEVVTKQLNIKMSNIIKKVRYISELEYTRDAEIELQQKKLDALRKEQEGINDSIESVKQRIQQVDTGMCPICYDTLEHPVTVTCCNHLFCVECLTKCLTQSVSYSNCPMCRTKVTTSDIIVVGKHDSVTPVNTFPTKHKVIQNLINSNKDGKFLIFSSHDQSFNKIQSYLIRENISNAQLMGSASRIQNVVNNYKDGNISVLMLNSQHFGSGLNLQNTTDLIFYHRMSEDMERQVIGRAQRFGRTSPLNVHYLCYNNEYKEYN